MTEQPKHKLAIRIIPVTPFQQNCSLLWHTETMEGVFIDPGGETEKLLKVAEDAGVTITKIWLTHGHLDHAGGADQVREKTGCVIEGPHEDDEFWLDSIVESWSRFGVTDCRDVRPDRYLKDGDVLTLGDQEFQVFHTPGHTPGHVVIFNKELRLAFVGDVLFQGSIGRTDFPRSNHQDLLDSITQKLWPLGNDVGFISGHGPESQGRIGTFGQERKTNSYVADAILGNG